MDPIFGLPVMRESKAMGEARSRNRTQERILSKHITELNSELRVSTMKILERKNNARELFENIHPNDPAKNVMCPAGLTSEQKSSFQNMRKTTLPSMTLDEFDKRLDEFRKNNQNRDSLCENVVGRRRRSYDFSMKQSPVIVPETESPAYSPLMTRKHRMKEALDRMETCDVRIKDENNNKRSSARRFSSTVPLMSAGSTGSDTESYKQTQNPATNLMKFSRRRNTVAGLNSDEILDALSPRKEVDISEREKPIGQVVKDFLEKIKVS